MTIENWNESDPDKYLLPDGTSIKSKDFDDLFNHSITSTYRAIINPDKFTGKSYATEAEIEKIKQLYSQIEFDRNLDGDDKWKAAIEFDKYSRLIAYTHWNPDRMEFDPNLSRSFDDFFDKVGEYTKDSTFVDLIDEERKSNEEYLALIGINNEHILSNLKYVANVISTGESVEICNNSVGIISVDKGNIGKYGFGLLHIIEQRFEKGNKSPDEITAMLGLVLESTESGIVNRNTKIYQNEKDIGTYDLEKNGIISFVSKTRDGFEEKFVITGFDDFTKKEEAGDAIKAVIANNSYEPEFVIVKQQVVATLTSSYILHLKNLKNNSSNWDSKRIKKETELVNKYKTTSFTDLKKEIDSISIKNSELDIWTEKSEKDNKQIIKLTEEVEKLKSVFNTSTTRTVPQLDKHNQPVLKSNGEIATATLHCPHGIDAALGQLARDNAILRNENQQLKNQLKKSPEQNQDFTY